MSKIFFIIGLLLLSVSVYAQQQVEATNHGIANARPGDFIIRSNGQRVSLNQGDIDYARRQLGLSTTQNSQPRQSSPNVSSSANYSSNSSSNSSGNYTLIIVLGIIHIIITICIGSIKGASWAILYFILAPIALLVILGVTNAGGVKRDKNHYTITHKRY